MATETVQLIQSILVVSAIAVGVFLCVCPCLRARLGAGGKDRVSAREDAVVFLFDDGLLVDATSRARQILGQAPGAMPDWQKMTSELAKRFSGLPGKLAVLENSPTVAIPEIAGPASLIARKSGSRVRVSVLEPDQNHPPTGVDHGLILGASDLPTLRLAGEDAPYPIWKEDRTRGVVWANKAYLALLVDGDSCGTPLTWPLPAIFIQATAARPADTVTWRAQLDRSGQDSKWFEFTARPAGDGTVFFALPADAAVRAENHLTNFLQTMTKTFADLPAGLAIFNRDRRLTLFNPALTDLLQLDAGYLATRPGLMEFFDHLRENRMMPEPKNYKSWREQMAQLDQQAQQGRFRETWTLGNGQTYRVTGRPHADGALAFLIEDISSEVTLTRRFRQELDQCQSVLDGLEQALAVFSPGGVLTQSNAAYADLWRTDPGTSLSDLTVQEATRHWQSHCLPSRVWGEIRDFVTSVEDRAAWQDEVQLMDGRVLDCLCTPIAGGATMVSFTILSAAQGRPAPAHGPHAALI